MGVSVWVKAPNNIENIITKKARENVEKHILTTLHYIGEVAVTYARNNHGYVDRTGNLTSSIGYVVCCKGEIVSESSFEQITSTTSEDGEKLNGGEIGAKYAKEIAKTYPNDYVLVVVAGMKYATYVERLGYDVLAGSKIEAEKIARELISKLK